MTTAPPPTFHSALTPARREGLFVLVMTVLAAVIRFWAFGKLGLTHFDEGIYAFAGLWSISPTGLAGIDPQVVAYAPPGFPVLIGLAYAVLGASDASALLVSITCGVLTVPVAAWLGRRTFGPGAGAAASAFTALSLAHIAFSRKALTDVPFLLTWLIALGLGGWFLERPRLVRALLFGAAVGLAQNFKYNGWIAGMIVALAAVLGLVVDHEARRPRAFFRTFGLLALAALVAAAAYWPWYQFVENHGGYADLIRHHRSYLGGPGTWLPYWRTQLAQVVALSGGTFWGALAWTAAWIGAGLAINGRGMTVSKSRWDMARLRVGWLLGAAAMAAIHDLAWWVGLAWAGWLLIDRRPALRVLGAWWLILSVMTPFYHPYARLWLPLHAAGWIMMAGAVVTLGPFTENALSSLDRAVLTHPRVLAQAAMAVACLILSKAHWSDSPPRPLPDYFVFSRTDGLRIAVSQIFSASPYPTGQGVGLRVLARRPVAFYLALSGAAPFRILPGKDEILDGPGNSGEWALVDEVQLGESLREGPNHMKIAMQWGWTASWDSLLDAVTQLDVSPEACYDDHVFEKPAIVLFAPGPSLPPPTVPAPTVRPGPDR
jgi:dolichyl-phosphate-mannose-protein mannosyltransferase